MNHSIELKSFLGLHVLNYTNCDRMGKYKCLIKHRTEYESNTDSYSSMGLIDTDYR